MTPLADKSARMTLSYEKLGQGPPILVLPGLLGSASNWRTIAQKLAAQYTLYLVDHRNHGRSFHTQSMDYAAMAEDVRTLIIQQALAAPILIGHSMGGKVAMTLAQMYPASLSKLIVVDIAPRAYDMTKMVHLLQILQATPLQGVRTRATVEEYLCTHIPNPLLRTYCVKNLHRNTEGMLVWGSNIPIIAACIPNLAQRVVLHTPFIKPTLFVRAGLSDYIRTQDLTLVQTMFPNYQLQCIEEATHWVNYVRPSELLQCITSFLATSSVF